MDGDALAVPTGATGSGCVMWPREDSSLRIMSSIFFTSNEIFPDSNETIGEEWAFVLTNFEPARRKMAWGDFTKELKRALDSAVGQELRAAIEFTRLRYYFFAWLTAKQVGFAHINNYKMYESLVWNNRLNQRYNALLEASPEKGRNRQPAPQPVASLPFSDFRH